MGDSRRWGAISNGQEGPFATCWVQVNHWEATGHVWVVDAGIWVETIAGARCRKGVQGGLSAARWGAGACCSVIGHV
jgi:hypothetical protein